IIVYRVVTSWSAEALVLDPFLMPLYFVITTLIFFIVVTDGLLLSTSDKLVVVLIHAFLTRIINFIFFFPGTSGDNTYHLAHERTLYIFGQYYMALAPIPPPEIQSLFGRLFVFQRGSIQYGLVTALSKALLVDVFWIHIMIVGVLWSLFVPIIAFKISRTLGMSNRVALLAGVLAANVPVLIGWSSQSVPNSLGFFFFFVTIYFIVKWLSAQHTRKYLLLTLFATVVSLLTHALTGIATLVLVMLAFSIQRYYSLKQTHQTSALVFMISSFLTGVLLVPAASVFMYLVYPTSSSYSLQHIFTYDIYNIILANYAGYSTTENLIYGTTVVLAIIGMILHSQRDDVKKLNLFMILAFIYILAEYRINVYFSTKPLFGLHRILTFEPFVTAPFVAVTIGYLVSLLKPSPFILPSPNPHKYLMWLKTRLPLKKTLVVSLICIGLSALIVEGSLVNIRGLGFLREPYGITSIYSYEAARLIHEEYVETGEKYAVVSDFVSEVAGMATVGRYNPNEFYLYRYDNLPVFTTVLKDMSIEPLLEATQYNNATQIYYVVSKYSVARYLGPNADFNEVVDSLDTLLTRFAVVGEGDRQVYVYRFRAVLNEGTGPSVLIYKDLMETQQNTTYSYWTLENVTYSLTVADATSYSITDWPEHWSYERITPDPDSAFINANKWVNFTGQLNTTYTIEWNANNFYTDVAWKDDAFLEGWEFNSAKGNYTFSSDGDIATETIMGVERGYAYYRKDLPALNDSRTLQVRLRGETGSYFYVLLWDTTPGLKSIVFNSRTKQAATEFQTYTFVLPANIDFHQIWLCSYTVSGIPSIIYWDYVMFGGG
ncbi:MAG: glycosyltransferase family 39 protein, partial [Candidatus Bathyarchaeota archaeon]